MFSMPALAQDQPVETRSPDPAFIEMLIKNTLVALNQANLTGNHSVLRELDTPAYQMKNSTARLAESYAALRESGIDMSGIVLLKPNLTGAARRNDMLELQGFFRVNRFASGFKRYSPPTRAGCGCTALR